MLVICMIYKNNNDLHSFTIKKYLMIKHNQQICLLRWFNKIHMTIKNFTFLEHVILRKWNDRYSNCKINYEWQFICIRIDYMAYTHFIARKYCFYLFGKNNVIRTLKNFKWVLFDYWRMLSNKTAACFVRMNWIEIARCLVKSCSIRLIIVPNRIDTATNCWINIVVKFFKLLIFIQGYMYVIFRTMEQMIIPSQSTS